MNTPIYKLILLPIVALLMCFTSCSKKHEPKDKEAYYFTSGNAPEDTKFFVNGNPTNRGNAISLFLIEGENEIDYQSEFKDEGYWMRIVKTKNLFSNDFEVIIDEEKDEAEAKKSSTATFKIDQWWRWAWQDCDTITEITDKDKEEILGLFDTMCSAANDFENNKEFLTNHPDILLWTEHSFFTERTEKMFKQVIANLPARSELVETKAPREEIEFIVGKQIILLLPTKSAKLYDLSAPPKENKEDENGVTWTYSLGFNEMFFAKKDGKWKMMLPVN